MPFSTVSVTTDPTDFRGWTQWLAEHLAAEGPSTVEHHLGALARAARRRQVELVACGVLTDPTQPEVVRLRAFAKVASALSAAHAVSTPLARLAAA
jgi:hypothetical protein